MTPEKTKQLLVLVVGILVGLSIVWLVIKLL
jgi:hypothetical protein